MYNNIDPKGTPPSEPNGFGKHAFSGNDTSSTQMSQLPLCTPLPLLSERYKNTMTGVT